MAWTTIEATYDEAAYWIARMLAHFPQREKTKDGIIIADIAGACVEEKTSLVAVSIVCEEFWRKSSKENPWLPPSGEILDEITDRTESYIRAIERLSKPKVALPPPKPKESPPDPFEGRKWPEFTEEDKTRFASDLYALMPGLRPMWRRLYDVPEDVEILNPNEESEEDVQKEQGTTGSEQDFAESPANERCS